MKTTFTRLIALTIGSLALLTPTVRSGEKPIVIDARLNTPILSARGGSVFVHLTIRTPHITRTERTPMNIAVVLDRSGSMGDERKMTFAKQALHRLIDGLDGRDVLSLVIYDDQVDVLRRPALVGDKRGLHSLVDGIEPRGSTNLGGGMIEGFRQASLGVRREYMNRVILLSDGLANQGITSPHELSRISRNYRSEGISLTTLGVGLDYNENLMVSLAENGGGNYYFIESARQLADIMRKELTTFAVRVCQDALLELRLGRGVMLKDVVGHSWKAEGDRQLVALGDLYGGEEREITVELLAPEGRGSIDIARGDLQFQGARSELQVKGFAMTAVYSDDERAVEKNRDMEVQAKADVAVSTRRVEKALQALDKGESDEAAAELKAAENDLMASPAAASGAGAAYVRDQVKRLGAFQDTLTNGDARKAKKSIQYENYQQQKSRR